MIVRSLFLPLLLLGSGGAFFLRLMQCRTGFQPESGLPVPGCPWTAALPLLLIVLAAAFLLFSLKLPLRRQEPKTFSTAFACPGVGNRVLLSAALCLLVGSGVLDLLHPLLVSASLGGTAETRRAALLLGILSLGTAMGLRPVVQAGWSVRRWNSGFPPERLLAPVGLLVVRLVLTYRLDANEPVCALYWVELLALTALTLAFFHLAGFAFGAGKTGAFVRWSALSVVLSAATLADRHAVSTALFFASCVLVQTDFLLMRLEACRKSAPAGTAAP